MFIGHLKLVIFPEWMYKHMLIGKFENMQKFGRDLLIRIRAWTEFGHKWGKYHNETLFQSKFRAEKASNARSKLLKYYTRELENVVFEAFRMDFKMFNYSKSYISLV